MCYTFRMNTHLTISDETRVLAEKRAKELGFPSVDEYVDSLIRADQEEPVFEEWMRAEIEEGLASGPATELTRDNLNELVREGIARAKQKG